MTPDEKLNHLKDWMVNCRHLEIINQQGSIDAIINLKSK